MQQKIEELKTFAKAVIAEFATDKKQFVTLAHFLLTFYMRENCTGPSVYT